MSVPTDSEKEPTPIFPARLYTGVEPEPKSWWPLAIPKWAKSPFGATPKHPNTFSWYNMVVLSPPDDQGAIQACISYAACYATAVKFRLRTGKPLLLAPRVMHLCTLGLAPENGTNSVDFEKAAIASGLPVSTDDGAARRAAAMASPGQCSAFEGLLRLKITSVRRFETIDAMKSELSTNGPVVAHITLFPDFWDAYIPGAIYCAPKNASSTASHAVCLIGYDDVQQYWIGINSRGKSWGEDGRFLLKYGECDLLTQGRPVYSFTIKV